MPKRLQAQNLAQWSAVNSKLTKLGTVDKKKKLHDAEANCHHLCTFKRSTLLGCSTCVLSCDGGADACPGHKMKCRQCQANSHGLVDPHTTESDIAKTVIRGDTPKHCKARSHCLAQQQLHMHHHNSVRLQGHKGKKLKDQKKGRGHTGLVDPDHLLELC